MEVFKDSGASFKEQNEDAESEGAAAAAVLTEEAPPFSPKTLPTDVSTKGFDNENDIKSNYCVPDELFTLSAITPQSNSAEKNMECSIIGTESVANEQQHVTSSAGIATVTKSENLGALGGLQVYDSDSDDVPQEHNEVSNILPNKYRDVVELTDSGSSSDSEESSTSESSSSSSEDNTSPFSDTECLAEAQSTTNAPLSRQEPKTEGELSLHDLPPIEELNISVPEHDCMEVGEVSSIVNKIVVITALKNTPALNIDSVLFLDKGQRTLGRIYDVIGPVCEPAYCVRFNSFSEIQANGIKQGTLVYCAPKTDHTSYIFLGELLKMKGSDASWKANNEPPRELLDYSDDEEERRARRRKRQASGSQGALSARDIVEPSSYERRMNAINLARSQLPASPRQQPHPPCPSQVPTPECVGRGRSRGVVIQNLNSASTPPEALMVTSFGRGRARRTVAIQNFPSAPAPPIPGPPEALAPEGVGRGRARRGVAIQNFHSAPASPTPGDPLAFQNSPFPPRRPGYTMNRFGGQPAWANQNMMPMFPNAMPPIPPPYQFGMPAGPYFSMPPPGMGSPMHPGVGPQNYFSTPPPPPAPNPFHRQPRPF